MFYTNIFQRCKGYRDDSRLPYIQSNNSSSGTSRISRHRWLIRIGACNLEVEGRILGGPDICHRGCAYTVLRTIQRHGVCSAVNGTVHYKDPLKLFEIGVGHSPVFWLPFVAILP